MTFAVTMPQNFIEGLMLGGEDRGGETIEQLESLLLEGETVVLATRGDGGGALFTDRRLIVVNDAGLFSKRSLVRFINAGAIAAVSIDASSMLELKLSGAGFGGVHLFFDPDLDPAKLSRWCGEAMAGEPNS